MVVSTNPFVKSSEVNVSPSYKVTYQITTTEARDFFINLFTLKEEQAYDTECDLYTERLESLPSLREEIEEIEDAYECRAVKLYSVDEFYKTPTTNIYDYEIE